MKKFLLISASVATLFLSMGAARAWDGDDTGKSRRTDDSYNRGNRGDDDSYDRRPNRHGDDDYQRPRRPRYPGGGVIVVPFPGGYSDRDHDGIPDYRDTYDNRYPPRRPPQDRYERDSDHDGTPDRYDRTPYGERSPPYRPPNTRPPRPDYPRETNKGGGTDGGSRPPSTSNAEPPWKDGNKDSSSNKPKWEQENRPPTKEEWNDPKGGGGYGGKN